MLFYERLFFRGKEKAGCPDALAQVVFPYRIRRAEYLQEVCHLSPPGTCEEMFNELLEDDIQGQNLPGNHCFSP